MSRTKPSIFWPLRLIAVISLVAPAMLFGYAAWDSHRDIDAQANERIGRSLDVLQEHALKAFQTVERSISEINEVLRGMSDEQIRAAESDLFLRFKRTQQALPQIESIWAFDRDGHPLVSSTILPVPRDLDNSDRSYFRAQKEAGAGTFVGEVVRARVGSMRFFVVSGRRHDEQPGRFNGVIGVTVTPEHFSEFYRKLTRGRDSFGLVRSDGTRLARFPDIRFEHFLQPGALAREIARAPDDGIFTGISPLDDVERRVGYRKVPGFDVYVTAGIETGAMAAEFWTGILTQLAIGLPAVLALYGLAVYALRRAQRFEEETARREMAEAALKQAQRLEAIGQLTGGVAHDFNNLLMVVNGNVERLRRLLPADERTRRSIEAIEIAVKRGADLTRQLLSFSRRQAHDARIVDLKERLPAIREMLQSSLRGDITVVTELPEGLWRTRLDVSEFELSILNLAVNARDAMSAGGTLTITARNVSFDRTHAIGLSGDFVAIGITDTGAGIPPEILGRVFEPFFTTKDVGKGTGLGLSQVYGFAQQAGGTATVASEPDRGTTVTLYLPRCIETVQNEVAPDVGAGRGKPEARAPGSLLLVEDNSEVADVTRSTLEEAGYVVHCVPDVASALALLRAGRRQIDIILTDIVMPGGASGLDLARLIRREYGAIPVILATGYSENAQAATEEGFRILRKPYDSAELHEAIAEAWRPAITSP